MRHGFICIWDFLHSQFISFYFLTMEPSYFDGIDNVFIHFNDQDKDGNSGIFVKLSLSLNL